MKYVSCTMVAAFTLLLAGTANADWWTNSDDRPRQIAPGAWHFSIKVPIQPDGNLQFVNAQYDFFDFSTHTGTPTDGMSVDYAYDGAGLDWAVDGLLFSAAPTLFEPNSGFIQGWTGWDIVNGRFEGIVYANAPLLRVTFSVVADRLVYSMTAGSINAPSGRRGPH